MRDRKSKGKNSNWKQVGIIGMMCGGLEGMAKNCRKKKEVETAGQPEVEGGEGRRGRWRGGDR